MEKNVVKINENSLRQIVAESVKKVLKEEFYSCGNYLQAMQEEIKRLHKLEKIVPSFMQSYIREIIEKMEWLIEY